MVTIVLVHGAGDTAAVWNEVQQDLPVPSLALDLPGRGRNPSDLSRVTVDLAVRRAVADIVELTSGPIVLVAHSIGGAVSPGILALLGDRAVHVVHIAAVAAAQGELPLAVASLEFLDHILADADALREALRGATLADGARTVARRAPSDRRSPCPGPDRFTELRVHPDLLGGGAGGDPPHVHPSPARTGCTRPTRRRGWRRLCTPTRSSRSTRATTSPAPRPHDSQAPWARSPPGTPDEHRFPRARARATLGHLEVDIDVNNHRRRRTGLSPRSRAARGRVHHHFGR